MSYIHLFYVSFTSVINRIYCLLMLFESLSKLYFFCDGYLFPNVKDIFEFKEEHALRVLKLCTNGSAEASSSTYASKVHSVCFHKRVMHVKSTLIRILQVKLCKICCGNNSVNSAKFLNLVPFWCGSLTV